jgi:hypothetical protein
MYSVPSRFKRFERDGTGNLCDVGFLRRPGESCSDLILTLAGEG